MKHDHSFYLQILITSAQLLINLCCVFFSKLLQKNFVPDEGWGGKYRSCSDFVNTPVLICQKNVVQKQLNNLCSRDFFNCIDGTCVL